MALEGFCLFKLHLSHTSNERFIGAELVGALHAIQAFREKPNVWEVEPGDYPVEGTVGEVEINETELARFDEVVEWMKSKTLATEKSFSFSSADSQLEAKLHLTNKGLLTLKPDLSPHIDVVRAAGKNIFMNCENTYRFLEMIANLVTPSSEASSRTWVDAFLYRAAAMLPANKRMVLNTEFNLTAVSVPTASGSEAVLVGLLDYTIIVSDPTAAVYFLDNPDINRLMTRIDSVLSFFVVEAKARGAKIYEHISQVVAQLYSAAKRLKTHIRGVLASGYDWMFVVLTVDMDGKGASYKTSRVLSAGPIQKRGRTEIDHDSSDLISGILATWIEHGYNELGDNDWFVQD